MDLQTVMLQEARKAYPSHEEVDQWAEQLLRQSETVAIHAEFVDYCPITVPFGNSPNINMSNLRQVTIAKHFMAIGSPQSELQPPY